MTQEQIFSCIRQFSSAAQLAVAAGATLLQIQASNGYLISSFLSPRTNRRVDDWGGTPLKRAKLLLSIIQEIRKVTNGQATLTVRLGIDDGFGSDGQQVELLGDVACALKESGIAAITCSIGVSETFGKFFSDREQAINISRRGSRFLKRIAGLPTGFTGSIPSISVANEIIESGDADFVGFARAVLADNNLVKKELAGREDEVTRCLWDSNCFRDKRASPATRVYCCVNPAYKRPRKLQIYYKENPA
jgi:2,4-dienoyl-CoA reductase-like NADH-dependent reductase (Old Yellow Enzyme family)